MANKLEEFKSIYGLLTSCCLRADGAKILPEVVLCTHVEESEPDEATGAAIVQTKDGKWYAFAEWQDYSGHGCQCDCTVDGPFDTESEAILFGLGEDQRKVLGLEVTP